MVRVEPELKTLEIVLGARLVEASGGGRKVVVHPVGGVARLLHHHGCESENRECDDSREQHVHDSDREPARDPHASQSADERVEEQGDEQRHEEEEDHVTNRSRHDPQEHEQQRQPHELHPARDRDPRRSAGARHASDGIAQVRRIRDDAWDWSFSEDGSLALDRGDLWIEPEVQTVQRMSRAGAVVRLNGAGPFDRLAMDMPSSRPTRRRRVERREVRAARRARRFALLALLAIVLVIALLLTAFGGGKTQPLRQLAVVNVAATTQTRPFPQIVAMRGGIRLQMPIPQTHFTAIGYHSASDGALALNPVGHQGNQGLVQRVFHAVFGGGGGHPVWYQLDSGAKSALDVGAAPGTDVYSPVDGTIVGITPYVVAGHRYGARIDIQPQNSPSLVVSLTQLRADPQLEVGSDVVSGATKLGVVADLARIERQALARYTNDTGNHVSVEIRPASALVLS